MKKNKKGFTLIELLAVIIILGVLMLVAIPSVTGYISSSRRSSFASTASEFIKSVGVKVNEGNVSIYDEETLYLFPIGNDETKSCIKLESGGKSPFSDTYNYGYVGVVYDGTSYDYYILAVDGARQGFDKQTKGTGDTVNHQYIIPSKTLEDDGGDLVVAGISPISILSEKTDTNTSGLYGSKTRVESPVTTGTGSSATTDSTLLNALLTDGYIKKDGTNPYGTLDGHTIKHVIIVGLDECNK